MSSLKEKLAKHKASKTLDKQRLESLTEVLGADSQSTDQQLKTAPLVDIELIEPDPKQARKKFDEKKLEDLSKSIEIREKKGKVGVKTPISIRDNPDRPGHYIINHGERRWRASKMVNKKTIPANLDNDYTDDDGVVENVQREDLTPREIADYIGRQLSMGRKKGEIAESLGKSNAYVTQHSVLLDLPDPIADGFHSGRFNDVTVINELVKAHKKDPKSTEKWLDDESQVVNRATVDELKLSIAANKEGPEQKSSPENKDDNNREPEVTPSVKEPQTSDPDKFKKAIVVIRHDERQARLMLDRRPSVQGQAWIKYDDDGHEFEASLTDVKITELIEG